MLNSAWITATLMACGSATTPTDTAAVSAGGGRYLYVSSGTCYGGGATVTTGFGTIAKYDLSTGAFVTGLADYNALAPGDQPVGLINYNSDSLVVGIENISGRRLDLVPKSGKGSISTFLSSSTGLNASVRAVRLLSDGGILVSKSTALEKFSSSKIRITQAGAVPFVSAPGSANCATTHLLITSMVELSNGKLIYAHAGATPNNKLAMISSSGYAGAADCLNAVNFSAPATTALPSSLLLHSSGKLLVGYGSSTPASNFVYAYDVDASGDAITLPVLAFSNTSVVNGPSAMAEDAATGAVFISSGALSTIEKFTFDPTAKTLTRASSGTPFAGPSLYTKCVSGLAMGD